MVFEQLPFVWKVSVTGRLWIISTHVVISLTWAVTAGLLVLIQFGQAERAFPTQVVVAELSKFLDDVVIIPCASLSLLSGLVLCAITPWGYFKHWWVVIKGLLTVSLIFFGTVALGPWLDSNAALVAGLNLPEIPADSIYWTTWFQGLVGVAFRCCCSWPLCSFLFSSPGGAPLETSHKRSELNSEMPGNYSTESFCVLMNGIVLTCR